MKIIAKIILSTKPIIASKNDLCPKPIIITLNNPNQYKPHKSTKIQFEIPGNKNTAQFPGKKQKFSDAP